MESRPAGPDEEVVVLFEEVGLKHLLAGFADLQAEKTVPLPGQAEGVLPFGPHGQHLADRKGQVDGVRGVAAGAPDGIFGPVDGTEDAVVAAGVNLPVVEQERVGQGGETPERLGVVGDDGLPGEVAGRWAGRETGGS